MKTINTYIIEKLHINKDVKDPYNYHPKNKEELVNCIKEKIEKEGLGTKDNPLDLNDIDTSEVTNMSNLFDIFNNIIKELSLNGYFNISGWDVSNVVNMHGMFADSKFNGDISNWDVSNVEDMYGMFYKSDFDGDISGWDVSEVKTMELMFRRSKFTGKNGDISKWNVSNVKSMFNMFKGCPLENNPPKWYI